MVQIRLGKYDYTELWDGVLYKNLPLYPYITDRQIKDIADFIAYNREYGREVVISADNEAIKNEVINRLSHPETYENVELPEKLTECTACAHGGCLTRFLCHTSSYEDALPILKCGYILSAERARGKDRNELALEMRNAAKDPPDYFGYVMLSWGNCQAGDRLVNERRLKRAPCDEELAAGRFIPGVRFYFVYDDLKKHPGAICDGVLPMRVKDGICLDTYVHRIVIPERYKERLGAAVPASLSGRVIYLTCDTGLFDWTEKVYDKISK